MAVHLIGSQPGALLDLPSGHAFRTVLRVTGETSGDAPNEVSVARRRAAALARLRAGVVQCPRKGRVSGSECAECSHLMAWRVTPDLVLYCGADDQDPVREWMQQSPPMAALGTPCDAADAEAARLGVHHMLVLDGQRHLVGIACRHDLARGGRAPVETQMSTEVFAVDPGTTLGVAATAMQELRIGCLPVVAGRLVVGMITRRELARAGASIPHADGER